MEISDYYHRDLTDSQISQGFHREAIGGNWEELGRIQREFLVAQGLTPSMKLLDMGCGAFRAGLHLIPYLDPGNYCGVDVNRSIVEAGYTKEIEPAGLGERFPRRNIIVTDDFDATPFGMMFDYALAQSLFTHLPLNHILLCLIQVAKVTKPGGKLYASIIEAPEPHPYEAPFNGERSGVTSYSYKDPYHHKVTELAWLASRAPWKFDYLGGWGHPRGASMLLFTRC